MQENIIWKKSQYRLYKGRWGISILLEAGYQLLPNIGNATKYMKITDQIYFYPSLLPYPDSDPLISEEQICFCNGLKLISKYLLEFLQDNFCLITLRYIQFSQCDVQNEGFTACAIQWASETFNFPMPTIDVYFDRSTPPCGKYVFDFSLI